MDRVVVEGRFLSSALVGAMAYAPDPLGWRRALLWGLTRSLAAQIAISAEIEAHWNPAEARVLMHVDLGWLSEAQRQWFIRFQIEGANIEDPMRAALAARRGDVTLGAASEMLGLDVYRQSAVFQRYMLPAGTGDIATAITRIGDSDRWSLVTVIRLAEDPPFRADEIAEFAAVAEELRREVGGGLADSSSPVWRLTPRLRLALELLLSGLSEAEAARQMKVSSTTLHGYVGELYRRFDVGSRPALHALFYGRGRLAPPDGETEKDDPRLARLRRTAEPMASPWRAPGTFVRGGREA